MLPCSVTELPQDWLQGGPISQCHDWINYDNKEWPGYILNTLLIPWFKAALTLAAEGVTDPATIDQTWMLDTGADPGQTPFRKLDKIGLPLAYTIFKNDPRASQEGTAEYKIAQYLKGYIDAGKTGIAVGEGFYKYE